METTSIPVRTALMPLCYKDFHCLAAACRDNCCGGWEIAFSKKDYLKIKRTARSEELKTILSGSMSRLRDNAFNNFYARFNMESGACAFQTEEGLCLLQQECGAEALPEVCRMYPRKFIHTSVAKERSLSPSCEAVLALLWDLPQGIDFLEEDLPKGEWVTVEAAPRMARFADIRSFCIDVLQERSLPLPQRLVLLGLLLQRLKEFDWTEEGVVDNWLSWGEEQLRNPPAGLEVRNRQGFLSANIRTLLKLYETDWAGKEVYRSLFDALSAQEDWESRGLGIFSIDMRRYQALEDRLDALLGHSDAFFENLTVMTAFYLTFPTLLEAEKLWRSYADLCGLYGFFRLAAVCGCCREASRERLFQVIGTASRGLLHSLKRRDELLDDLFARGEGTLPHLAVLVGG